MPAKAKLTTRERTSSNISSDNLNKGSELSFAEADSNFINLRDQTIAISDGTTSTDIEAGETITFSGASVSGNTVTVPTGAGMTVVGDDSSGTLINGGETLKIAGGTNITTAMSGDTLTITGAGGGSSSGGNLGDLQVNGTVMTPVSTNADLTLDANGTGDVVIKGAIFETDPSTSPSFTGTGISAGSTTSRIEFHDNGTLYHRAGSAFNALSSSGHDLNLYTNQKVRAINATGIVVGNANIDVEIESQSGGSLTLKTGEGDNPDVSGFIKIQDGANQDITITPNGSGQIVLDGLNWPTADGSNGQVLTTDGAGNLSFTTSASASTGDFTFTGNEIKTTSSNANAELDASGTGHIHVKSETLEIGVDKQTEGVISSVINMSGLGIITTNSSFQSNNGQLSGTADYEPKIMLVESDRGIGGGGGGNIKIMPGYDQQTAQRGNIILELDNGELHIDGATTSTTVGSNGAASALTANPVGYLKIKIAGTEYQIPYYNV